MLRKAVTLLFAFCLAAWVAFTIVAVGGFVRHGFNGTKAAILHVAGQTSQFGALSWNAALARLIALALITAGLGYLRRAVGPKA